METEKAYSPFCIFAVTIPVVEAAAGKNWLPSLILALLSLLICTWASLQEKEYFPALRFFQKAAAAIILAAFLGCTHQSWPGKGAAYVVPAVLLALGAYAVWRGSGVRGASVLRYGVYLILLLMATAALQNLTVEQMRPRAEIPDTGLAAALLLPLLGRKSEKRGAVVNSLLALATTLLTTGGTTLYAFSKGLSIGGIANHVESLAASALLVGWFAALCYILDSVKEKEERDNSIWLIAAAAYGIYLTGFEEGPQLTVVLELTLWGVLPTLCHLKNKRKKKEKGG